MVEEGEAPRDRRHLVINAFIVTLLFIMGTSALPTVLPGQDTLREKLDFYVDSIGLWQGQWDLFGPKPDSLNVRVIGIVEFEDGSSETWSTPDPHQFSLWQKFRYFRHMEYADGIRRKSNRGGWAALADYLVRNLKSPTNPSAKAKRVELWRHFIILPKPKEPLRPIAEPFPLKKTYRFYTRELGDS